MGLEPSAGRRKVTIRQLQDMKGRGERIVTVRVYDSVMATIDPVRLRKVSCLL
jgi:hypothetical protein